MYRFFSKKTAAGNTRRSDFLSVLLVIYNVYPRKQELSFLLLALYGLRSCNDRQPLLNVLLSGVGLLAEQVEVLFSAFLVAVEVEQKVGSCYISGGVALSYVEKNSKLAVGPTSSRPGPMLFIVAATAVKLVIRS